MYNYTIVRDEGTPQKIVSVLLDKNLGLRFMHPFPIEAVSLITKGYPYQFTETDENVHIVSPVLL